MLLHYDRNMDVTLVEVLAGHIHLPKERRDEVYVSRFLISESIHPLRE
jgi:hypothetical protein